MPNHLHFLLQQRRDGGISAFMHLLGTSYVAYFNSKYKRKGRLFSSTFHAVPITSTAQLLHISRYIHLNPLDLYRDKGENAFRFVQAYPWSSFQHFLGLRTNPIVDAGIYTDLFHGPADYESFVREWHEAKPRDE